MKSIDQTILSKIFVFSCLFTKIGKPKRVFRLFWQKLSCRQLPIEFCCFVFDISCLFTKIHLHFSLKAEWMYSQSKGRQFLVGQHDELLEFLLSVCPLHPGEDWEEDKKLNLILSKVQEHQQSLREPGSGSKFQLFHFLSFVNLQFFTFALLYNSK